MPTASGTEYRRPAGHLGRRRPGNLSARTRSHVTRIIHDDAPSRLLKGASIRLPGMPERRCGRLRRPRPLVTAAEVPQSSSVHATNRCEVLHGYSCAPAELAVRRSSRGRGRSVYRSVRVPRSISSTVLLDLESFHFSIHLFARIRNTPAACVRLCAQWQGRTHASRRAQGAVQHARRLHGVCVMIGTLAAAAAQAHVG